MLGVSGPAGGAKGIDDPIDPFRPTANFRIATQGLAAMEWFFACPIRSRAGRSIAEFGYLNFRTGPYLKHLCCNLLEHTFQNCSNSS